MKLQRPSSADRGFTLLEVMLAAVVLLVGIVGAATVLITGTRMLEVSRQQSAASQIIHSEIERVHLMTWSQFSNGNSPVDLSDRYPASRYPALQPLLQSAGFQCVCAVSDVDPIGKPNYKQVRFTVSWQDHRQQVHTRESSTYVAKNGLYVSYQR